jgi:hypothetical protein
VNRKLRLQGIKMASVLIAVACLAVLTAASLGPMANAAAKASAPSRSASPFAGKTVWVVDVNSNEDYKSLLLEAVEKFLPQYAGGAKVKRVKAGDKNPFFLLREENYPAAVIVGTGVCVGTTPQVVNYASSALKLGIPAVILHIPEMKETREKQVQTYRVPDLRFYEVAEGAPATAKEAALLANAAAPALVKALVEQMKK